MLHHTRGEVPSRSLKSSWGMGGKHAREAVANGREKIGLIVLAKRRETRKRPKRISGALSRLHHGSNRL